jgi:hypothetical protein
MNSGAYKFEKPETSTDCSHCEGYGRVNYPDHQEQCAYCYGTGKIEELPETVEEQPTVSLYNLLDHAEVDLMIAGSTFKFEADRVKEYSPKVSETLYAWAKLFEAAIREKKDRDSEDWAEKTAKEINETTK